MRRNRIANRAGAFLITAILAAALALQAPGMAMAEGEKAALTIQASSEGQGVAGVEWSVYQVAEMPRDGEFTLTKDFGSSGLDIDKLNGASQTEMQKNARKLSIFAVENKIKAAGSLTTDKTGRGKISGLERGLYLVYQTGTPGTDWTVESIPFFVSLPMMADEGGKMVMKYEVTAAPKLEVEIPQTTEGSTEETEGPTEETEGSTEETEESKEETESSTEETKETEKEPTTEEGTGSTTESSIGETESATSPSQPDTTGSGGSTGGTSGGSSGGRDRDRGRTTVIIDNNTPLASFLQPEPEMLEIEDEPVPLAALPSLPKMGDMGTGAYAAGMLLSFLAGGGALIRRKKYTGEEE